MSKIDWSFQNESGKNLNRYKATNIATGEVITFDLLRAGTIDVVGTQLDAITLNQLKDAINDNYDNIIALQNRVKTNETDISNLQNVTSQNTNNISANATNITTNQTNISNLQTSTSNNATKINTLETKVENAETSISNLQNSKADKSQLFSQDYNDLKNKPTIPSVEGLITEKVVNEKIANATDNLKIRLETLIEDNYLPLEGGTVTGNLKVTGTMDSAYSSSTSTKTTWLNGKYIQYGTSTSTSPSGNKNLIDLNEDGKIYYYNGINESKSDDKEIANKKYVDSKHLYEHNIEIYFNTDNQVSPPSNKEVVRVFFKIYLTTDTLITGITIRDYIDTNPIQVTGFRYTYNAQTKTASTKTIISIKDNTTVGGSSLFVGVIDTPDITYVSLPVAITGSSLTDTVKQIY